MIGRELRHALLERRPVFGTVLEGFGQPRWPRYLAQIGLDFVFLDTEHSPVNRETTAWAAQLYGALGIAPLVRIPEISPAYAAQTLDLGAHGVIVPYVETMTQAKEMVGAVKYRPFKGAVVQNVFTEAGLPGDKTEDYLAEFNENSVLILMIESPTGLSNLPEILSVPGIDGIFIGPHDFSVSSGVPEMYESPPFKGGVSKIIETCLAHQVSVGIHMASGNLEQELQWIEKGCNLIIHSSDTLSMAVKLSEDLAWIKERMGLSRDQTSELDGGKGHAG
jgi:4-hydroxy-2-oxoheptanedioate aldolase